MNVRSVEMPRDEDRAARPPWSGALLLCAYAAGIAIAVLPGQEGDLRLVWHPAAGLRLAILWHGGWRITPAVAAVEVLVVMMLGILPFAAAGWPLALWGVVGPVLVYGATVAAIRRISGGGGAGVMGPPMPFGLAAVAAPAIAALTALPGIAAFDRRDVIRLLTVSGVNDLLGVMLVAPPLLWAAAIVRERRGGSRPASRAIRWGAVAEATIALGLALFASAVYIRAGLGSQPAPVILAVVWVGLRFGRLPVWIALAVIVALIVSADTGRFDPVEDLQHRFDFATVVVAGYLAGTYRDAQKRALEDVGRRDRLLFQAERLKTLRAMSVAVIHEISQPLSTLAIEAKHLREITARSGEEIAQVAALIDRKATTLSDLVRRLRRFGGGAVDRPSPLPVAALLDGVVAIVAAEARTSGVALEVQPVDPDLVVLAQEIELIQAVVNLLRNAIHAASDGRVALGTARAGDAVAISVVNRCRPEPSASTGMGVGTLVAQAIVEAHGGRLTRMTQGDGRVVATITLPLAGDAHEWR